MSSLKERLDTAAETTAPQRLHLDKRIEMIIAAMAEDARGDDLLTTQQLADWWGTSVEWLELRRAKGYGPKVTRLGARLVRYKRSDALKFLKGRLRVHAGGKASAA